jgi:glutaconyl-CoA/methylmalonyl-CoA decarboxylase subunit delta
MNNLLLNIENLNFGGKNVALVGIVIVFAAFVLVFVSIASISGIYQSIIKNRSKNSGKENETIDNSTQVTSGIDAAISAAIFLYLNDIHDKEDAIMTIKKISKAYSPWSSKIYSVRWPLK